MSAGRLDASTLQRWAHAAVAELISHTDEINQLNVFPVADADFRQILGFHADNYRRTSLSQQR